MPNNVLMYKSATPLKLMKDQMPGSKNHNAQSLGQIEFLLRINPTVLVSPIVYGRMLPK